MKRALLVLMCVLAFEGLVAHAQTNPTAEEYFKQGDALAAKADWDGAIAAYTKAIDLEISTKVIELVPAQAASAYYNRGNARKQKKDLDGAVADYTAAIKLVPDRMEAYCNRGLTRYSLGNYADAIADMEHAIQLDPAMKEKLTPLISLARQKSGKDVPAGARLPDGVPVITTNDANRIMKQDADLQKTLETNATIAESLRKTEELSKSLGQVSLAPMVLFDPAKQSDSLASQSKAFESAFKSKSEEPAGKPKLTAEDYLQQGVAKANQSDLDGAIADFSQAITLDPRSARPYCHRAIARFDKGDAEGAMADCNKAVELEPNYAPAYCQRGITERKSGKYDAAIADLSRAIELKPDFALAYKHRGFARYYTADYPSAISNWEQAIRLDPTKKDELSIWIGKAEGKLSGKSP